MWSPVIACGLQAFQQLCGFNTLMYYSATLFKSIGFNQPTAVGEIVAGTNFLFTLFALKYIDIIGRRRIMIWSAPGMVLGLTLASISFHCKCSLITRNLISNRRFVRFDSINRRLTRRRDIIPTCMGECRSYVYDNFRGLVCHRPW